MRFTPKPGMRWEGEVSGFTLQLPARDAEGKQGNRIFPDEFLMFGFCGGARLLSGC
jgi:hypothetical protein